MAARRAIVLVNLGTPDSPTARGVRRFLKAFLSDPRVVKLPRWLWLTLLNLVILPLRAKKVARLYQKIWWPEGSPLRVITERQAQKLSALLAVSDNTTLVRHAMVYGEPSLATVTNELRSLDVSETVILPLYPQYCAATTGSVEDQVQALQHAQQNTMTLQLIKDYHDDEYYITALADSVQDFWGKKGRGDFLLFSFHGIPQALIDSGDPYYAQCHVTAERVAKHLRLAHDSWRVAFQSRFGKAKWAKPYTNDVIAELAHTGVQRLDVIAPSFASDCLETLEEISLQTAALFRQSGGKQLVLIPCLNDSDAHIAMMKHLFEKAATPLSQGTTKPDSTVS